MTDIGDWPKLIGTAGPYVTVPLNEYQIGNLVDALAQVQNTGDWWGEFLNIIAVAMEVMSLDSVRSNRGNTYTRDQIALHRIR